MDFQPQQSHLQLWREAVQFAQDHLNEGFVDREQKGEFSRELWVKCAEFGIQGLPVPRMYGGNKKAADVFMSALTMEALGYGCRDLGLLFGLSAQIWTVQLPLLKFGSVDQKKRFLPPLCSGQWIAADAMTEPEAGSDVFSMETTATPCEGGYRLNGRKCLITFAPIADVALVFATTDRSAGQWGMSAFMVDTRTDGFSAGPCQEKMGLRTVPIGELSFDDCFVPVENRIGDEGDAFAISQYSLEFERCCILASQVGAMQYQVEQAVTFAKSRRQFGQSIGKFQSVSNRIADMKVRLEMAKLMLRKIAWMKQQGQSAPMEAAVLKLYLSEAFVDSSMDAIRVQGGQGYLSGNAVEHSLRDSVGGLFYAGTSDIQRNIISALLGL